VCASISCVLSLRRNITNWLIERNCMHSGYYATIYYIYVSKGGEIRATVPLAVGPANIAAMDIDFTLGPYSWTGRTDLWCGPMSAPAINDSTANIEMKVPFDAKGGLYQSQALRPKQQLLGQAFGLWINKPSEKKYILSYLSDLFAISVLFYMEGFAYLSKRVVDPKSFCMRLLLICSDITIEEWRSLYTKNAIPVDLADGSSVEPEVPTANLAAAGGRGTVTRSMATGGSAKSKGAPAATNSATLSCAVKHGHSRRIDYDEEESLHRTRLRDLTNMIQWDAQCKGYLGKAALDEHTNSSPRPFNF
jgi:hypothetical protein